MRAMDRALPLLLCILLATPGAHAQAPETVFLEELTWTELQNLVRSGKTTIIVPIGGTEQNGPHIALGKHNMRVKALSEKIALALGDALVAPVLAYVPEGRLNPPTAHMRFPGTITVPGETFEKVLEYAARSFKLHGFRDILFLGDHGDYQANAKAVADRLNREWAATPVRVHAVEEYYRVTQTEYVQALKRRGLSGRGNRHARRPRRYVAHARDGSAPGPDGSPAVRREAWERRWRHGDPRRSSAELGQLGVDAIVARTVEAIRKAVARR